MVDHRSEEHRPIYMALLSPVLPAPPKVPQSPEEK